MLGAGVLPAAAQQTVLRPYRIAGEAIPDRLTETPGDPARGRAIVLDRRRSACLLCHSGPFPQERFQGNLAPDLSGTGARWNAGQLRLRLVDPTRLNPATIMPAYYRVEGLARVGPAWRGKPILDAQEIEDVLAFLAGLRDAAAASPTREQAGEGPQGRRSGYDFIGPQTRAMQDDDGANPGMLWVAQGAALWREKAGAAGRACADCHGDATDSMRGVAARYPQWDATLGRAIDLEGRILHCGRVYQQTPTPVPDEVLALSAFVARQSRGLPIAMATDGPMRPVLATGEAIFRRRQGQFNLSCAQCHDDNAGKSLAGNPIPQAHPTGYPLYRLEWQALGSLQRRLRNCLAGVRAEPLTPGGDDLVALEAYLMARAQGMAMESPAVRP